MKRLKDIILLIVGITVAVFMILDNGICAKGVRDGLISCADTLIPTLFPFMVLSKLMLQSGALKITEHIFSKPFAFLFRLPAAAVPAVIISFVGGFPVGAALADSLYREGKINRTHLEIMLCFCVCGGPAFLIGAVGERLFGNPLCGIIIYISIILSAVCVGFVGARLLQAEKPKANTCDNSETLPFTSCLVNSVEEGTKGMIVICAFVLLFSAVDNIISSCISSHGIADALIFPLEVTGGVTIAAQSYGLPAAAGICSFSGLAVICQILALLSVKTDTLRFFVCRICSALLSFGFCSLMLKLFPSAEPTYKNFEYGRAAVSEGSLLLPFFLILMSVVFLLSLGKDTPSHLDFTCDI